MLKEVIFYLIFQLMLYNIRYIRFRFQRIAGFEPRLSPALIKVLGYYGSLSTYKLRNFTAHLPSSFHVRINISKFISHFKNKGKTQSVTETIIKYGEETGEVYKLGCAVFATFIVRFEAKLGEYGSYSHHSLHIRFKIFAQIRI